LAKKWQDVEFVDYKERQRRRRMRKRLVAEEEVTQEVSRKWSAAMIGTGVAIFIAVLVTFIVVVGGEREFEQEREARLFVEALTYNGDVLYRKFEGDEYKPLGSKGEKYYDGAHFRTGMDANLQLRSYDDNLIKISPESELAIDKIELSNNNENSKLTTTLEKGEYILDSRKSFGYLEIRVENAVIYTGRSLLKVIYNDAEIALKVKRGQAKIERFNSSEMVGESQRVIVRDMTLGEPESFNPLSESW
jgi:hypothetical protein